MTPGGRHSSPPTRCQSIPGLPAWLPFRRRPGTRGHVQDPPRWTASTTRASSRNAVSTKTLSARHPQVLRKTIATLLDEAGHTARQAADILGHAHPSMTQDVYLGRSQKCCLNHGSYFAYEATCGEFSLT